MNSSFSVDPGVLLVAPTGSRRGVCRYSPIPIRPHPDPPTAGWRSATRGTAGQLCHTVWS
jgi:hypothetical protein